MEEKINEEEGVENTSLNLQDDHPPPESTIKAFHESSSTSEGHQHHHHHHHHHHHASGKEHGSTNGEAEEGKAKKEKKKKTKKGEKSSPRNPLTSASSSSPSPTVVEEEPIRYLGSFLGSESFPKDIFRKVEWQNVVEARLSYNSIKEIPDKISKLSSLNILDLSYNQLEKVPSELAKLPSLTELHLSSNRLTSLPENFHLLGPILTKLEVNENHFDSWPFSSPSRSTSPEAYSTPPPVFTALRFLNVSHHNRLGSSIPDDAFVVFPSLTHLKLGRIGLHSLPSSLTTLFSLVHLSLEMNYLTTLPPSFLNLKRLRHLNISYNDFSEETLKEVVEVLENLKQLEELSSVGNPIQISSPELLQRLRHKDIGVYLEEASVIEDRVLLAGLNVAQNKHHLKSKNVTHILSVLKDSTPLYPDIFVYKVISMDDRPTENLFVFFQEACNFIDEALSGGGAIFIHCAAGISRSASILIAWVMKTRKLRYTEAFEHVKKSRTFICPNRGFQVQLKKWERELGLTPSEEIVAAEEAEAAHNKLMAESSGKNKECVLA